MKHMKWWVMLAVALYGSSVFAQSIGGPPFIAVHGKAKTEVVPDVFPLKITLEDTSMEMARAQALIEDYARQIVDLTRKAGMEDADVTVGNLSVSPEYRYDDKDDKQVFLGNTYRREIELEFHDLDKLRQVIESLPQAKQVRLETETFKSSNADNIRRELLERAVANARETADVMARAVGRRVGNVHNISNSGFNIRYVEPNGSTTLDRIEVTGSRIARAPPVVLEKGSIELQQDVYVIYTLTD